ncbi:MAG: hypothetical protein AAFQ57_14635 [Cyanobacteria bacterium J06626_14]
MYFPLYHSLLLSFVVGTGFTSGHSSKTTFHELEVSQPSVSITVAQAQERSAALSNWVEFSSINEGFSVSMPSAPVEMDIPTEPGILNPVMFMQMHLISSDQLELYGVVFTEYPEPSPSPEGISNILDSCGDFSDDGDRLINTRNLQLDQYVGRELEYQNDSGQFSVIRCYVVGRRFYGLMSRLEQFSPDLSADSILSEEPFERTRTMNFFFNSFRLLN